MYEVRVDSFSTWHRVVKVAAVRFEVLDSGVLVFSNADNEEVMVFAAGKWVYVFTPE